MLGSRNRFGLTLKQIESRVSEWRMLCGERQIPLDVSEAAQDCSQTRFNASRQSVILGANVLPGTGVGANARMSALACLAHELAYFDRFEAGYDRPYELPDVLLDEAETSIRASFESVLSPRDREDLVEDGRDRLNEWLDTNASE